MLGTRNRQPDIWDDYTEHEVGIIKQGLPDSNQPQAGELVALSKVVAQLQEKLNTQENIKLDVKPKQSIKRLEPTDPSKLILSLVGIMSATSVLCVGFVSWVMFQTSPARQMAEMSRYSVDAVAKATSESTNAIAYAAKQNASIAKVASKERSNSFSLISLGSQPTQESSETPLEASTTDQPQPPVSSQSLPITSPSGVKIQRYNLNIRNSPDGEILNTIPIGDSFLPGGQVENGWLFGTWIESNLSGWVSQSALDQVR